jgi:hypothetical protein
MKRIPENSQNQLLSLWQVGAGEGCEEQSVDKVVPSPFSVHRRL